MGLISLVDEIQFMLISSHHICIRSILLHCANVLNLFLVYSITDAFNETKDKVKYLEALRKYFDHLNAGNSIGSICSNVLPGLMASVRQMDSISRFYARNGYLGLLFSKVGAKNIMVFEVVVQFMLIWLFF